MIVRGGQGLSLFLFLIYIKIYSAPVIWPTKDDDKATESQTGNRDDHVKTLTENVAVLSDRLTVLHKGSAIFK